MSTIELITAEVYPFAQRTHMTLIEKGLDMTYHPFFERMPTLTHYRSVTIPDDCLRLNPWVDAMMERDSVRQTMHHTAYYIQSYTKYAVD
ncbi:MAG: hypothetical protein CMM46_08770 [Rhodospirillaceae bacterium]|nr:hypothetical protein [Rhodospirillaceae bacterium]|tara:strand:- start:1191 stop:1460 length:270 start_codon:yes stop_codon:yes gene_type:complete